MALLNPRFEEAGVLPGEAAHWTLRAVTSLELIAGFESDPEEAWEGFERWHERLASLDDISVVRAFFDGAAVGFESFERGWRNHVYLREMPPALLVSMGIEGFEEGWLNDAFAFDWKDVNALPGLFDGMPFEAFETRWRGNEAYVRSWDVIASGAAFDGGAAAEGFEGAWPRIVL